MIRVPKINGFSTTPQSYAAFIDELSGIIDLEELGESCSPDLKVYGCRIGNCDNSKPIIVIQGGIHGNEKSPPFAIRRFIAMLKNPANFEPHTKILQQILLKYDFYFIPILNPTGWVDNTRNNRNGVNLNRNYDINWQENNDLDKGSAPFSEPETRISRDVITPLRPVLFIDCHEWGSQYFQGGYAGDAQNLTLQHFFADFELSLRVVRERHTVLSYWGASDVIGQPRPPSADRYFQSISTNTLPIISFDSESSTHETTLHRTEGQLNTFLLAILHTSGFHRTLHTPVTTGQLTQ